LPAARILRLDCGRFLEQLDKTMNVPQRRAQIMRNGIGERLEFLVGHFQQFGALPQLLVQFLDVIVRLLARVISRTKAWNVVSSPFFKGR